MVYLYVQILLYYSKTDTRDVVPTIINSKPYVGLHYIAVK